MGTNAARALCVRMLRLRHAPVPIVRREYACGSVLRLQHKHIHRVYLLAP